MLQTGGLLYRQLDAHLPAPHGAFNPQTTPTQLGSSGQPPCRQSAEPRYRRLQQPRHQPHGCNIPCFIMVGVGFLRSVV